jgi:hypothetical protein|tara:strand:+ start:398 stop:706 length:309 start_codon:yes stop_codon:yes gene_type:complete
VNVDMEKIRNFFKVESNYQLFIVNLVFAVTGTLAVYFAGTIIIFVGLNENSINPIFYWIFRILLLIPVYQFLLIIVGTLFGEFSYFWEMEKKMLNRFIKKPQ